MSSALNGFWVDLTARLVAWYKYEVWMCCKIKRQIRNLLIPSMPLVLLGGQPLATDPCTDTHTHRHLRFIYRYI